MFLIEGEKMKQKTLQRAWCKTGTHKGHEVIVVKEDKNGNAVVSCYACSKRFSIHKRDLDLIQA